MPDKFLRTDPDSLEELQKSFSLLKEKLDEIHLVIANAIELAGEFWKDYKYEDFCNTYSCYQEGIANFASNLELFSTTTLQKDIDDARNYDDTTKLSE